MDFKKMREYTHEEFVNLILSLNEEQLLELSAKYGGYPVLFRMALDDRISHIPFIQTGAAIIIRNENEQILLHNTNGILGFKAEFFSTHLDNSSGKVLSTLLYFSIMILLNATNLYNADGWKVIAIVAARLKSAL